VDQIHTLLIKPGHPFDASFYRLRGYLQPRRCERIRRKKKKEKREKEEKKEEKERKEKRIETGRKRGKKSNS